MLKPTSRRISLQPVFQPVDLLQGTPMMPPLPTNGYHSESLTSEPLDEAAHFNGHHAETNGNNRGLASNGSSSHDSFHPDEPNPPTIDADSVVDSEPAANGHSAVGPIFALNGAPNQEAEEFDAAGDLAELAAARQAFFSMPPELVVKQSDAESANGTPHGNGAVHSDAVQQEAVHGMDTAHLNGRAPAAPAEIGARGPILVAPPVVETEPPRPFEQTEASTLSATDASATPTTRETHPASGSLFVPYLVTEIRELRDRRQRRRSWWRRIFG